MIDEISEDRNIVQHYHVFKGRERYVEIIYGIAGKASGTEGVFQSFDHEIRGRQRLPILIQYEVFWPQYIETINHGTRSCHCDLRGSGIEIDDATRFPTLFTPVQKLSDHLQPVHDVAIFSSFEHKSLLSQQQSITVDEIAYSSDVGKGIPVGHLYHGIGMIHSHSCRCTTCRQCNEIAVGAAGKDFKIGPGGVIPVDLPTSVGALNHDGTECCLTKRLIFIKEQLITFVWQQQAGIEAVGRTAFGKEF